ncbi:CPBP family intramembrane metalloprotease [Paenibacillus sp. LMG 31459]|uniref:CPBP family intramembrane metalloprotease n=1 Tax=Paenibacillus phytohabitans TaxID=2654978 RepID=A0ABX1YAZ9_9BACL|nr:CPBP family intramembrane glutamic endopeptidase [Paenibacillus phytohabitans]NOU78130.1 CPBP family intramembrane metalloprotease [Paenibacillus phytohabitans]
MKNTAAKGHPVIFSLMLGVVLTLLVSVASAVASIQEFGDMGVRNAQACAFLVMAIIVTVYMKRKDSSLVSFGFRKLEAKQARPVLFYIPMLLLTVAQPLMSGINVELTAAEVISIVIMTLLVGYTEESIFRGIIRDKLKHKGPVFYIVFSSVFFGVLHMANALGGKDIISTLLQVANALLLGFVLALLIEAGNNIIPLIGFHFIYDALAMVSNENVEHELLLVSILNILYLLFGIYLLIVLNRRKNNHSLSM